MIHASSIGTQEDNQDPYDTFVRDIPSLLQEHNGEWVAYKNDGEQLGIDADSFALRKRFDHLMRDDYTLYFIEEQASQTAEPTF